MGRVGRAGVSVDDVSLATLLLEGCLVRLLSPVGFLGRDNRAVMSATFERVDEGLVGGLESSFILGGVVLRGALGVPSETRLDEMLDGFDETVLGGVALDDLDPNKLVFALDDTKVIDVLLFGGVGGL